MCDTPTIRKPKSCVEDLNRWSLSNNVPFFLCVSVISLCQKTCRWWWARVGKWEEERQWRSCDRAQLCMYLFQSDHSVTFWMLEYFIKAPVNHPLFLVLFCLVLILYFNIRKLFRGTWMKMSFLFLFFFFPWQSITSGISSSITSDLNECKVTWAPEYLPPEYSVSTSLCLPMPGALKWLHYALREIS